MSESAIKPRIGIIGTGAIGGFYGVMLARAGFDVHFLLRSEFDAVARNGLTVDSQVHGLLKLSKVQAYACAADMPPCDWLLIGAKTTGNGGVASAIVQAAAPGAKVLLLQNGLGVEDALRAELPDALHLWAGCASCVCIARGRGRSPIRRLAPSILATTAARPTPRRAIIGSSRAPLCFIKPASIR